MIVSLLYQLTRRLLSVPAVLLHRDSAKDAELLVLRHQNAVLRRQITGQVRYQPADRFWFAVWHRAFIARKWDYSARRRLPGGKRSVRAGDRAGTNNIACVSIFVDESIEDAFG